MRMLMRKLMIWMFLSFSFILNAQVQKLNLTGEVITSPFTIIIDEPEPTPVGSANVMLNGTTLTDTTNDQSGLFTINDIPENSTYILSVTKTGYVKTYTIPTFISGYEHTIFTLTETKLNNFYSSAGITKDPDKGTIVYLIQDPSYGNLIFGVSGIIKKLDGTDACEKIVYGKFVPTGNPNEYDIGIVDTPETGDQGTFVIIGLNATPGVVMISGDLLNYIIGWRPAFVFQNSLTSGVSFIDCVYGYSSTGGYANLEGKVFDEEENPISNANVKVLGVNISNNTGPDGSFSLFPLPYASFYILQVSKTNYKNTIYFSEIGEGTNPETLILISNNAVNEVLSQIGASEQPGKGHIFGKVEDKKGNSVRKASLGIYSEDGNLEGIGFYYFTEENGIDTSLVSTTDDGEFLSINIDPNKPIYTTIKKKDINNLDLDLLYSLSLVLPDSISSSLNEVPLNIGHLSISQGPNNPSSSTFSSGASDVKMLHIKLQELTSLEDVSSIDTIILTGSGTGNEQADISLVKIWNSDASGNLIGYPLASGSFSSDDGKIKLHPNISVPYGGTLYLMISYDFGNNIGGGKTYKVEVEKNTDIVGWGSISLMEVGVSGAPVEGNFMTSLVQGAADITVDPSSIDFGEINVGSFSDEYTITILSSGTETLTISNIELSSDQQGQFEITSQPSLPLDLNANETTQIKVKFTPTTSGTKTGTIIISSNDPDENPFNISLTGKGIGAAGGGGGGGCFIATAAFGSYQEKHVWILRQFRDKYLLKNKLGKAFVRWYYKHSPKYAEIISNNEFLKKITRVILLPLYGIAYLILNGYLFLLFISLFSVVSSFLFFYKKS